MGLLQDEIEEIKKYQRSERFAGITRVFTAAQVAEQRGAITTDYTVARAPSPHTVPTRRAWPSP
jgi:isocitrate lyase